jgi:ketosteroid isomerase-like protein
MIAAVNVLLVALTLAAADPDVDRLVERWVALWNSYDLDVVDELFLQDSRVTYFSSEKEGLIRGIEAVREHHKGFGFVSGGKKAERELWLENVEADVFADTAVVAATWFFGSKEAPAGENQRGPMTLVLVRVEGHYRLAHLHFASYR